MTALSHVWSRIQETLFPALRETLDPLSEQQEKLVAVLELVRVEELVRTTAFNVVGRPPKDRQAIARALIAKALYSMPTTAALIERLNTDRNLRRICGFERRNAVPKESTFSRAFTEFAEAELSELAHAALIAKYQAPRLVGHIARDATEIDGRERPGPKRGIIPPDRAQAQTRPPQEG